MLLGVCNEAHNDTYMAKMKVFLCEMGLVAPSNIEFRSRVVGFERIFERSLQGLGFEFLNYNWG